MARMVSYNHGQRLHHTDTRIAVWTYHERVAERVRCGREVARLLLGARTVPAAVGTWTGRKAADMKNKVNSYYLRIWRSWWDFTTSVVEEFRLEAREGLGDCTRW
jgi:hypothetical protein